METCHFCGQLIPDGMGRRRKIETGQSYGTSLSGDYFAVSHTGIRTLCPYCAAKVDGKNKAIADRQPLMIAILIIMIAGVIIAGIVNSLMGNK